MVTKKICFFSSMSEYHSPSNIFKHKNIEVGGSR